MGSIKKALKPITRVVDDIIPNEIKPALPYLAATFGAPYLAGSSLLGGIGNLALRKGIAGALTNVGTQALLGKNINPISAAASGIMAGGGQFLTDTFPGSKLAQSTGKFLSPGAAGDMTLTQAATAATAPLTAGTMQAAYDEAEKANREYDEYVRRQEEAGAADIQTRIDYITRYMTMAGFDRDQIDDALRRAGYRTGGRVGFAEGGSGTLGDSMQSIKILLMKNEIIEAGGGGFGGKDLDDKTDDEIIEIYEGLFGQGKANGGLMATRVGYKIGGSTMQNVMARLLNIEVPAERLEQMRQNRADFLFNENVDAEDYPSQDYLNKVREAAEKQATKELEEYMKKIGMDPLNPPEDSMSDKLIDQIMQPRKEGRVKEAKGGRIEYAKGGSSSIEQQKRENYFDLKRDEFMSLSEYLQHPMSDSDLRSGKAEGGIMNLKMGGMPAEMDLRGGGFVPIGAKEKADDVPARLSKNEFVMTADAVRAAGGGSVNKGAKRMYDLMNKLEARV